MTHTPGPWKWRDDFYKIVGADGLSIITASDGSEQVHSDDLDIDMSPDDARLIAAAPDLLTACKRAEEEILSEYGFSPDWLTDAIEKAEAK